MDGCDLKTLKGDMYGTYDLLFLTEYLQCWQNTNRFVKLSCALLNRWKIKKNHGFKADSTLVHCQEGR